MKFAGYTYQPSLFVLTCFQPDDLPMFSRIDDLLLVNQEPFLCVTEYFTEGIDHHFHSYVIQCTNKKGTIHLSILPEPRPINSHCLGAIQYRYITLRSQVLKEL